jgi:hypothetical protein
MTRNKDFKQLVRARMRKTGESYTTSRAQLLRKRDGRAGDRAVPGADAAARAAAPALDVSKAGMTDAAVRAKTGKTWAEWVELLDRAGMATEPHREIARYVHQIGVPDWWAQTVTVGYERIRGLRDVGQRRGGGYEVNKSKTCPVPVAMLYDAFANARRRNRWLPGVGFTVRTATPHKSMRVTWEDGSDLQLLFSPKGVDRSAVSIQHGKLGSRADADRTREYWTQRLDALSAILVGTTPKRKSATKRTLAAKRTAAPKRTAVAKRKVAPRRIAVAES